MSNQQNETGRKRGRGTPLLVWAFALAGLVFVAGCQPGETAVAPPPGQKDGTQRIASDTSETESDASSRSSAGELSGEQQQPSTAAPTSQPAFSAEETLPTIRWQDAEKFMGREVFLVGPIAKTGKSKTGHVFLNFPDDAEVQLTAFIYNKVAEQFSQPPEEMYEGKLVKIRGDLYRYQGQPNIRVAAPQRIEILPPETSLPKSAEPGPAERRVVGDTITIAAYNVMNLFDTYDDAYRSDEGTRAKSRSRMEALARSLRGLDADIVALAEVENRGILEQFNGVLLPDMGYAHVVHFEGNDRRGIDVALLSRLPVGPVTSYRHLRFPDANGYTISFRRDLLRVRIEPENDGLAFDVFLVHFKSKGGDGGGAEIRIAEAQATRTIVDELLAQDPQAAFVICGDFNDTIDSKPLQTLIGSGETALCAFVDELPVDERITYNQRPYLSMIDFILASPAMARRYVPGSYRILPGSPTISGSDHNPVAAQFRIRLGTTQK